MAKLRPNNGKKRKVRYSRGNTTFDCMVSKFVNTIISMAMRLLPRMKILVKTWMVKKCFPLCRDLSISLSVGEVSGNSSPRGTFV